MSRLTAKLAAAALLGVTVAAGRASANPESYEYRVIHPAYGDVGTYTNIVDRLGDNAEVRTDVKIQVRLLGITVYRQEAQRVERWQGQTLLSFDGVTVTNGDRLEVHGAARNGGFAITTPTGTVVAPSGVHPSNPWSAMVLKADVMMSTRTGKVAAVQVSAGEVAPVALDGASFRARQYEISGYMRHFVWLSDDGTPVAFRTNEDGTLIDFVLERHQQLTAGSR
jgi:Family of unknown function (DUF6134)